MALQFLTLADHRLAYQRQVGAKKRPGLIFLGGFASDMEGTKAAFLADYCAKHKISFVRFDYRGCGSSPGVFAEATIGDWLQDSLAIFDKLTAGPQIVVGSSMGGWIGLLLAKERRTRVKALIGIAAAPDFTEDLIWKNLSKAQRAKMMRDGVLYEKDAPPDRRVPLTLKLIKEARKHFVFKKSFPLSCPVRLMQGMQDEQVPWQYVERIAQHITQKNVRVTLIKKGDHRLSTKEDLALMGQTIAEFL